MTNITVKKTPKIDDSIKLWLREIGNYPLLSLEEEQELSKRIKNGDEEARTKLINSNLRLVVNVAKKYMNRGVDLLDLIQEGNTGLMKAVDKFDHTRGYHFSTYAVWWIKQGITRAISDHGRTIRIPVHMIETINKIFKAQRTLLNEKGKEPTPEEISKLVNMPAQKVVLLLKTAQEAISLDTPIGDEEDSTIANFIQEENTISPTQHLELTTLKDEIDDSLTTLTEREEGIIRLRFGLNGTKKTLEEIGDQYGVTRERIRQIETKALGKLSQASRGGRLKIFYDEMS